MAFDGKLLSGVTALIAVVEAGTIARVPKHSGFLGFDFRRIRNLAQRAQVNVQTSETPIRFSLRLGGHRCG
jgi:hypothetical protein